MSFHRPPRGIIQRIEYLKKHRRQLENALEKAIENCDRERQQEIRKRKKTSEMALKIWKNEAGICEEQLSFL